MRTVILSHYFHPEIGAPSARLHSLARELSRLGHAVTVVTCFPNHPTGVIPEEYRGRWTADERLDGFRVLRVRVYAAPNEGVFRKTLGHLSFMATSVLLGGPRLGKADVIVASSPTLFSVLSAWALSVLKGVPFVFEVRDLWPAVFAELGVVKNRRVLGALEALEMFLYRRSAAVVTVTESFRDILVRRGVPEGKVTAILNGVDLEDFTPGPPDDAILGDLAARGKFVVLYMGALGLSHALERVLDCAKALSSFEDLLFVFVGEGARKAALMEQARGLGLRNIRFVKGQPRERVLSFYRSADVCLVPLKDIPLFETFIPSKMFEIMGCGRPIVASVRGEAARLLEASGAAVVVAPEDIQAMGRAILGLRGDAAKRREMGAKGRDFVEKGFDRRDAARRYAELLRGLVRA